MNNREKKTQHDEFFMTLKKEARRGERENYSLVFMFCLVKVAKNYYFTADIFQNIHISIKISLHFFLEQCVTDLPKNIARFQFDLSSSTQHFRNIFTGSRNLTNCAASFSLLSRRHQVQDGQAKLNNCLVKLQKINLM